MVVIKGKVLLLIGILVTASVTVTAYHATYSNPQLGQPNVANLQNQIINDDKDNEISDSNNNLANQQSSTNNKSGDTKTSKSDIKTSDSQSIAQTYIEEPNAVAGKPERYTTDGKSTDVVPVLMDGERVGEIEIDPETGENVGGAGGAP